MDKFGIFKLLNSFLNFNGQKADASPSNNLDLNSENNNILSKLLSSINNASATKPAPIDNTAKKNIERTSNKPLQANMLNTITSHEEFIKRVKQKNSQ